MNTYIVYLATNRPCGALYTGVTNDMVRSAGKLELVEAKNPGWRDLWYDLTE